MQVELLVDFRSVIQDLTEYDDCADHFYDENHDEWRFKSKDVQVIQREYYPCKDNDESHAWEIRLHTNVVAFSIFLTDVSHQLPCFQIWTFKNVYRWKHFISVDVT